MRKILVPILVVTILLLSVIFSDAAASDDFLIDNGVLIRYTGKATKIVIPDGVTVIGEDTFFLKDIVSVTMPDSVTVIENGAFSLCRSLTKVTLSKNLKSIGGGAFAACPKLKSIRLPNGLERIGDGAFNECTLLTDMNIPATVTYIGSWDSLPLNWTKKQKQEFVILGDGILYKYNGYYGNGENVVIPNNVKIIGEYAFSYDHSSTVNMKSVTIPGSVKEVRRGAFHQSSDKLTKVTIGEGVMSIAADAFGYCSNLTQVNIPKSLSDTSLVSFREPWSGNQSEEFDIRGNGVLFKYKGNDANVIIPDGVKHIYPGAFANNSTLQTVIMPQSVVSIGDAAFMSCYNLVQADIPNEVRNIGEWTFYSCTNLRFVKIPQGVTSIEESTFYGCRSLTQIDIPDTVTSIGKLAFANAYNLTKATFANGLKSIGHYAFVDCRALNGIILPPSVTYIGNMAFQNNTNMSDVTIQNPNMRIYENIFFGNSFSGSPKVTIKAPVGGSVQRIAARNKIPFKAIP